MTTLTPTVAAPTTEPKARFRDLIASEWIKLRSLRSTYWGLGIAALAIIGGGIDAAYSDYRNYPKYGPNIRAEFVPFWALRDAFTINACLIISARGDATTPSRRTVVTPTPASASPSG